jgi:hypothetical protein
LLLLLLLASPVWSEPRTLYTEVCAHLRGAERDLGILERMAFSKNVRNVAQWDQTTQALARLEAVWSESRQRLDKANPPKHKELWEKTSQMLALQQGLATRCALVVQIEYAPKGAGDPANQQTLKRIKDEIDQFQADYNRVSAELSRRL